MTQPKNRSLLVLALPLILAVVSLGCGLSGLLDRNEAANTTNDPTPTRTPMPTFTPTPPLLVEVSDAGQQPPQSEAQAPAAEQAEPQPADPTATATLVIPPSPTTPPQPTDTPTPQDPTATLIQNMNVRGGPGTNYPVIGSGPAGKSAKIIGRNTDGSWLQVEYAAASEGVGWLYSSLVQVNGDAQAVAVVSAPPPPPPPPPTATPEPEEPAAPPPPQYQFTPTGWYASENAAIVHFKGRIKDEGGNLVNGYSILVDNWSWSVISHPSGASHHYPEKGDGEWDVVIPADNLGDGVGWWWLTVVRYECSDFFARFDAQCKQFTRLSEDIKIEVKWPEETIINADWICHWDCDKGLYTQGFRR